MSTGLHVAMVEPEIPWNTGNAARTCLAAGASLHLVHPLGFVLDDRRIRRAGMDYWPEVELHEHASVAAFEATWPRWGRPWVFAPQAERSLWELDLSAPSLLIFGGESRGLRAELLDRWRPHLVRIPMAAGRSLNLSTCVGVAAFEARRQRA